MRLGADNFKYSNFINYFNCKKTGHLGFIFDPY